MKAFQPPQYQAPVDPNLKEQTEQADRDKIAALQLRLRGDTASTLARFGRRDVGVP